MPHKDLSSMSRRGNNFSGSSFWVLVFGFALFFSPKSYAVGSGVFYTWRLVQSIVSAVAMLLYLTRGKISLRWTMFMLFLFTYYLLSTFIMKSGGSYRTAIYYFTSVGGFVSLLEYGLRRDRDSCLDALLMAGILMCGVHYYTFLRYRRMPLGMRSATFDILGELTRHPWFFFTHDNGSAFYFLPMIGALWYRVLSRKKGLYLTLLFTALTLYMYWSLNTVTAKYATAFLVLCIVYIGKYGVRGPFRLLTYQTALLIGISLCIVVVSFYSSDFFVRIAEHLGKSSDLGRGRIWQRAWPYFWDSPLIGVGFEEDATVAFKLGINHCHNIVVQVLYTGGIVTALTAAVSLIGCKLPYYKKRDNASPAQVTLFLTIIMIFVCATFDWYLYMPIQFLPFFLYHYSAESENEDLNNRKIRSLNSIPSSHWIYSHEGRRVASNLNTIGRSSWRNV